MHCERLSEYILSKSWCRVAFYKLEVKKSVYLGGVLAPKPRFSKKGRRNLLLRGPRARRKSRGHAKTAPYNFAPSQLHNHALNIYK